MKVLVLGSYGFIGLNLIKHLSANNGLDLWEADINAVHGKEKYFQLSTNNQNFDDLFKLKFDFCINCTGAANVGDSIANPQNDYNLNCVNVFNALDSVRKNSPKCTFINLSSAAVYGNPKTLPIKESAELQPLSPYGFHKEMAEESMREFSEFFGITSISLRIFSCFGPGLKKQIFWDAYRKMNSDNFSFFGSGMETRDFIYVEDVCKAIALLLETNHTGHEIYNLASGTETTIKDALECFQEIMDYKSRPKFTGEVHKGQPINWRADISKLESLGFKTSFSLAEGLSLYKKWLLANEG